MMEGPNVFSEGLDSIRMKIVDGEMTWLVPSDVPDENVCDERWLDDFVQVEFTLEDGSTLTLRVQPPCDQACAQVWWDRKRGNKK
jgi:hypothetical protein